MSDLGQQAIDLQRMKELRDLVLACDQSGSVLWQATTRLHDMVAALRIEELITVIDSLRTPNGDIRSIVLYRMWLQANGDGHDQSYAIWYNLGVQHASLAQADQAIAAFKKALSLKPDLYQASINLGLAHEKAGRPELALKIWREALQPDEGRITLFNHTARVAESQKRYKEADEALVSSLLLDPQQPDALHHWISIRAKTCTWPIYGRSLPGLTQADMIRATSALNLLSLFDELSIQTAVNANFIAKKFPEAPYSLRPETSYGHERLRIGYLSSDFCRHPMTFLVAELFERHDRTGFEIYGFDSTNDDGSQDRQRVLRAFDHVRTVRDLSDEEAARQIRADEIDILIDLNGLTYGSRLGVLRWRPAPVQMHYLGYNGPIPMPELDYILADDFVTPPDIAPQYHPKPLCLPRCYQANDALVPIWAPGARAAAGLPEDKFVFCCFSASFKITEEIFSAWEQILRRTENTVLWLYADHPMALENLAKRAAAAGLFPGRLIFADRVEPEAYRGRLALADLFLDTFPYNAGTTASDALRAGLPIVTLAGKTFIARMAGSLLHAVGGDEGITYSVEDYIDRAVALATDRERYAAFRAKTSPETWMRELGDTPRFAKELEELFITVSRQASMGLAETN